MSKQKITILQLYPKDMNIYGDEGNLLVIKRRLQWYGYEPVVIKYNVGDTFPDDVDMVIGGGGQDSGQEVVHKDLLKIGAKLHELADNRVPMLMVCGMYQLFGKFFHITPEKILEGINILDVETYAKSERLIGNIVTHNELFGDIIGYENHSGQTFLGNNAKPFGEVRFGAGNNTEDVSEGARYKNVIGTYMHGSILPKNPQVADFLIQTAVTKRYGEFSHDIIDDQFADLARAAARKRPR